MTDPKTYLRQLKKNHNILKVREAKYANNVPLELLNQIADHEQAIALTRQVITDEMSETEWAEALKPLLVSLQQAQTYLDQSGQTVTGDQYNIAGDLKQTVTGPLVQIVQQAGLELPAYDLPGQLAILEQALPQLDPLSRVTAQATIEKLKQVLADLPAHEQAYRERLKARYAEDAPYYIPLAGETTETSSSQTGVPRSTRRRRERAVAEYHQWVPAGQEIKRVKLNTLREGVDKYDCIILLGDPGSGKTTALEHLAYELAAEPAKLPLPLRLSEFGPGLTVEEFIVQGWAGSVQADHWGVPELAANLTGYLAEGRLFVLFDALNEMPSEGYRERAQALRRFIDRWAATGNRFLVTCRVLDYGEELSGLQRIEIQPLTNQQIFDFISKELGHDWGQLWFALTEGQPVPPAKLDYLQSHTLELARNPYLLTVMIDIFLADGQLGRNRAELLQRFSQIQFNWAKSKTPPAQWLAAEVQAEALSVLAFETQRRAGFGTLIKTEQVKAVMPATVQPDPAWPPVPAPPDQVLTLAANAHIIEMPVDKSSVRFYHQLLQEYFAAWSMLKRDLNNLNHLWRWPWLEEEMPVWVRPNNNWEPLPPPPPTGWEETTILAAGLAPENDGQLIRAVIEVNPVLAGRCLHEGQARVDQATRQAVIEVLLQTIARPEVALRVRIAAGEVLGYLGDPRLGELVTIPAGEFLMGEDEKQHTIYLPEYQIGKYPLTNAEYAAFIEAGGYRQQRWWTEAGWQKKKRANWTEPDYWHDSRFNKPNQPVVGVSWYEGVAYCRWLRAETGQRYHLPTEAEWEKAARGPDGRRYPWGDEFEASRLNSDNGKQVVRSTTPVGIYPTGLSPYGAFDCAGNVWEWGQSKYEAYPYQPNDGREDLEGTDVRVLRGGSWLDTEFFARCASRDRIRSYDRFISRGCRVVVSPSF